MGNYVTSIWWGGDPDVPDDFSGLSRRDIYTIQTQWTTIYAKAADYGMEIFFRLFRKDRSTQQFFRILQGLSEAEITRKPQFKAHVQNFMGSWNTAILNLHHPEVVAALMNKLGITHTKHGLQRYHFEEFKEVLIDFLENNLKLDEKSLISWSRLPYLPLYYKNLKNPSILGLKLATRSDIPEWYNCAGKPLQYTGACVVTLIRI